MRTFGLFVNFYSTMVVEQSHETANSALILYKVLDLPFSSANVTTNVVIAPRDPRCAMNEQKIVQKKETMVQPDTLAFVKIDLAPQLRYQLQSDLILPIELPGLESSTIRAYVGLDDNAMIDACSDKAEI